MSYKLLQITDVEAAIWDVVFKRCLDMSYKPEIAADLADEAVIVRRERRPFVLVDPKD